MPKTTLMAEGKKGSDEGDCIILVIGETGVGKSTFINQLVGKEVVEVGHSFSVCTTRPQSVEVTGTIKNKLPSWDPARKFFIVDTPGFNGTIPDSEILKQMDKWLDNSYGKGAELTGVIYLHDIHQPRAPEVIGTTNWRAIPTGRHGMMEAREQELRDRFWRDIISKGSTMWRVDDGKTSPWDLVESVLFNSKSLHASASQSSFDNSQKAPAPLGHGKVSSISQSATNVLIHGGTFHDQHAKQSVIPPKPAATAPIRAGESPVHTSRSREAQKAENAVAVVSQPTPDSSDSDDIDSDDIDTDDIASDTPDSSSTDKDKRAAEVTHALKHANTSPTSPPAPAAADDDDLYCSWSRVAETTENPFPDESLTGPAPFRDLDGGPIFIGSAILECSVEPCKIGPSIKPSWVSVCHGGMEYFHSGRYDILPGEERQKMEWVPAAHGRIPHGRRPVVGGCDEEDNTLYHALGVVDGFQVPGKTAKHLSSARLSFDGREHKISQGYFILCWKL